MTITTTEIVKRLGIRSDLIIEWRAEGVIPKGTKVGRRLRWTEADFEAIRALFEKRRQWRAVVQQKRKLRSGEPLQFSNPLVAQLMDLIFAESSLPLIAERAGYSISTLRVWYRAGDPRLTPFTDVASALGYELVLRKKT